MRTPSSWTVSFFVNLRAGKRSYGALDYQESNLELLRESSDLWEIVRCVRAVPPLGRLRNGSVSLFRNRIRNIWEDPENRAGYILKLTLATSRGAAVAHCAAYRRLCPVIATEDLGDLWEFLVLLAVSGALDEGAGASGSAQAGAPEQCRPTLNGLYCKAAESIVTLEFWFRSRGGLEVGEKALRAALGALDVRTPFRASEVPSYKFLGDFTGPDLLISLEDTIRVTSMQTGITRGKSASRDGGEDLWGRAQEAPRRVVAAAREDRQACRASRLARQPGQAGQAGQADRPGRPRRPPLPRRRGPPPNPLSEADTLASTTVASATTDTPSLGSEYGDLRGAAEPRGMRRERRRAGSGLAGAELCGARSGSPGVAKWCG